MKYLSLILRILVGVLLVFSAYIKYSSLNFFEINLVENGLATWTISPYLSRILIGFEYITGVYLVLGWFVKKYTIPVVAFSLVGFNLIMAYLWITKTGTANCGCFGSSIPLTPEETILKNFILLFVLFIVYKFDNLFPFHLNMKYDGIIYWAVLLFMCSLLFISHPMNMKLAEMDKQTVNYRPPLELLYAKKQMDTPRVDLRKDKWIVAFLSLKCFHCNELAQKLSSYKQSDSQLPFYFVLNGDSTRIDSFMLNNKVKNISFNRFVGAEDMTKLAGNSAPIVFWLNNGIVVKKTKKEDSNYEEMVTWMEKK